MRHDAAYVGFFHTIFGVTELLYFFLLLDKKFLQIFSKFFVLYCILTFNVFDVLKIKHKKCLLFVFFIILDRKSLLK